MYMSDNAFLLMVFLISLVGGLGLIALAVEAYIRFQQQRFHNRIYRTKEKMGKYRPSNKYHI